MTFPNLFSKILPRVPMTDIYHHWPFSGYSAAGSPPCAISVLLTYSFSVTYSHARRSLDAATRVLYCLKYIKKPENSKDSYGFFSNKSRYITAWHSPPIRIGANYPSPQRYLVNPRSPMNMQCGTAEKFGNPVYFAILSQYNTEGSLQVGCLFLEMKMK